MPSTVHLVGSHGAEFDSGFSHDIDRELLQTITDALTAIAAGKPGVTVETKPASVALHVRNASPADGEAALRRRGRRPHGWDAHATAGKAVLEFAVISTDKGEAIDILRDRHDAIGRGVLRRRRHRREGVPPDARRRRRGQGRARATRWPVSGSTRRKTSRPRCGTCSSAARESGRRA